MLVLDQALRLGQILMKEGMLNKEKLDECIDEAEEKGTFLEKVLIKNKILTEREIVESVSHYYNLPSFYAADYQVEPEVLEKMTEALAKKHAVLPVSLMENELVVAMSDPQDIYLIDELSRVTGCKIDVVIGGKMDILKAIERWYHPESILEGELSELESAKSSSSQIDFVSREESETEDVDLAKMKKLGEVAPIIELSNNIILEAVNRKASDIHLEPFKSYLKVRFRIDGLLQDYKKIPKWTQAALLSRFKIMGNLDIAKKRIPQDGRIDVKIKDKEIDLRISTLPVKYGEKIVVRILEKDPSLMRLDALGFDKENRKTFEVMISKPFGMIIITGPTGSGKTTTLYAALNKVKDSTKNIVTVEDPIEYDIEDISQSQVHEKAGLTFAAQLRSILRQDPDIIMLGEMRDFESAEMAFRASMTGHLVFSTLHTNDAASCINRLMDMGVEPYLIASSVIGIIAQRLVRVLCQACKESYTPDKETCESFRLPSDISALHRAKGCKQCGMIGYQGRVAVYELMHLNDEIKRLITSKASANVIRRQTKESGMQTLRDDLISKLRKGITSLEEANRVGFFETD
ncbi:MAG: Flp pilus assembly complex ATPase component TadA [Firmicutes bacterium]|nr:Flp pilus assembly complex ATPase component TadA [Bacillota bacterium]